MALADVAATLTSSGTPWRTCVTCHALTEMSDGEATILRGMLADRRLKVSDIARALEADPESPTIPRESLARHARGDCSAREILR